MFKLKAKSLGYAMEVSDFNFCCPSKRITTRANSWTQESTRGVPWNNQSSCCWKRQDLKRVRGKSQWKVNVKINLLSDQWHLSFWITLLTDTASLLTQTVGAHGGRKPGIEPWHTTYCQCDLEELPAISGPCFSHLQVRIACISYWYLEQCLAQSTYSNQC